MFLSREAGNNMMVTVGDFPAVEGSEPARPDFAAVDAVEVGFEPPLNDTGRELLTHMLASNMGASVSVEWVETEPDADGSPPRFEHTAHVTRTEKDGWNREKVTGLLNAARILTDRHLADEVAKPTYRHPIA